MGRGAPERPVLEALTLASAALAQHPTLCVGTLVLDVTKRHPALVAKSVATITSFAPGRLLIGLGAGGNNISTIGYGEDRPSSEGESDSSHNANRRAAPGILR